MPPKPSIKRAPPSKAAVTPVQLQAAFNEAVAVHQRGELARARAIYTDILKVQPRHASSLNMMGVLATQQKQFGQAVALHDKAIAIQPDFAPAYVNRGIALKALGKLADAIASYGKAIALKPQYATALFNRGNALAESGQHAAAVESYDSAIAIEPGNAEALFNRGKSLHAQGEMAAALAGFDAAIAARPESAEAHAMRGNTLLALNRPEEALAGYAQALSIKPQLVGAWTNRGVALGRLKRWDEAIASHEKAIAIAPAYAEAHANLGNALTDTRQHEAAKARYDVVLRLRPEYAEVHTNLGTVYMNTRRLDDAIASFDEAIRIQPDYAEAHCGKAFAVLLKGGLAEGFRLFEWRWKSESTGLKPRPFKAPLWLGKEQLAGRTILLHSEQGLGDTIQFARYIPMVEALGARVFVETPKPLMGLFKTLQSDAAWIERGAPLPRTDFQCPLLSLPLAFATDLHSVPHPGPYLSADSEKVEKWAAKLGPRIRPRVGLAWSGNAKYLSDRDRSLALATLAAHLPRDCDYFSLQNEVRESDHEALAAHPHIRHFGSEANDFTEAAALCELMDVIVSVDTSLGHLGGALGKPTWVMLAYNPDWRWMHDRSDSPWYSSVRLYRQERADGAWGGVLEKVAADLASLSRHAGSAAEPNGQA